MALSVTVENEAFPEDHEFSILGLGTFVNGEAREVSEEEEKMFISLHQQGVAEKLSASKGISISGNAAVTNLEDVLGKEISDTPSLDPTAMNLDENGEVFAGANLTGASTDPGTMPYPEELPETTIEKTESPTQFEGGENL